ncbi:YolD-like family protein [Pueribacillus sp. YX66]|uniref:YolD-like family protein n=1 Tax=Pueribacillus sp. YX66 TaxID=3229242 RepID=UPI00358CFB50
MTFKPSKITPGFNLTWESSRMMLPEHVAMLQQRKQLQRKRSKPELDMQAIEELECKIQSLVEQKKEAVITVFEEFGNCVYLGKIAKIDPVMRRIKLVRDGEDIWIKFDEIIEIEEK